MYLKTARLERCLGTAMRKATLTHRGLAGALDLIGVSEPALFHQRAIGTQAAHSRYNL
jgi:hypothetical protein